MILVVDDESDSRTQLTAVLSAEGYPVRAADSGELALASVAVKRPQLILLDIRMPGIDGFDVCRRLKENRDTRGIPIIFLSTGRELSERIEGFRLGGVDFVTKPFQREELLARVRTHMELARLRTNLEKQVAELKKKRVSCTQAERERWGIRTTIKLPSGGEIGLYEPTHPSPLKVK